jgi:hypothetical protein
MDIGSFSSHTNYLHDSLALGVYITVSVCILVELLYWPMSVIDIRASMIETCLESAAEFPECRRADRISLRSVTGPVSLDFLLSFSPLAKADLHFYIDHEGHIDWNHIIWISFIALTVTSICFSEFVY